MDMWTAVVGIVMVVAVTIALAIRSKGQTASKPLVVVVYGLTASLAFAGVLAISREAQHRATELCKQRVERSLGAREFNLTLIAIIDREIPDSGIGDELREALEENLPLLNTADCNSDSGDSK